MKGAERVFSAISGFQWRTRPGQASAAYMARLCQFLLQYSSHANDVHVIARVATDLRLNREDMERCHETILDHVTEEVQKAGGPTEAEAGALISITKLLNRIAEDRGS